MKHIVITILFACCGVLSLKAQTPDSVAVDKPAADLPIMDYATPVTMPALALSFRLYGTSTRADEVAAINSIRHAGFVPGMETIEVLSDVG